MNPAVGSLGRHLAARGLRVQEGRPLAGLCTYRVGGAAALFVTVEDDRQLRDCAAMVAGTTVAVLVVGRGSNLLVADEGFDGLALQLGDDFATVEVDVATATVRAGGAASLPVVARRSAGAGLAGFEWAVGVPGSIGGAVRMNAGGHGADIAASLQSVHVVDLRTGEDGEVPSAALELTYRHSTIDAAQVVAAATLALAHGDVQRSEATIAEIVRWRRDHQPGGPNAGSVFTNPPGDSAGRLIDAAGCKGLRVGSAEVSTNHPNFTPADPGGSPHDVVALMAEVRRRVFDHSGVDLVAETRLVGFGEQRS